MCLHSRVGSAAFAFRDRAEVLNDTEARLHHANARAPKAYSIDGEGNEWGEVESIVFSPEDMGIPVRRARRYSCILWAPLLARRAGSNSKFEKLYYKDMQCDGSIFIKTDASEHVDKKLTAADTGVLAGHLSHAHDIGLCDKDNNLVAPTRAS